MHSHLHVLLINKNIIHQAVSRPMKVSKDISSFLNFFHRNMYVQRFVSPPPPQKTLPLTPQKNLQNPPATYTTLLASKL